MTMAQLSSGLLARKGSATPSAAVPRPTASASAPAAQASTTTQQSATPASAPGPSLTRVPTAAKRKRKLELDASKVVRLSLRLDARQHRRLRVAAAHMDCSLQSLVAEALDRYIVQLRPQCPCLQQLDGETGRADAELAE